MNNMNSFRKKIRIEGDLTFETAFHIGSGREGELATDMGVLIEPDGRPILPGSTLKGSFRAFAERLSGYLGLKACSLDNKISGELCFTGMTDSDERKAKYGEFKALKTETEKLDWIKKETCDVCRLFGSPLQASRIFFSDGNLTEWVEGLQIRDGVCIDRDTETARHGAKYDFEVVPAGAQFRITIELENPEESELALIGAVLSEWEKGFRLGGFTSRGLGRVRLGNTSIFQMDYGDTEQLKSYLIGHKMRRTDTMLTDKLEKVLNGLGGKDA